MTPVQRSARTTSSGRPQKRSLTLAGHRTSASLEREFWDVLSEIARNRKVSVARLVGEIDAARDDQSLSGALRVFILKSVQAGSR